MVFPPHLFVSVTLANMLSDTVTTSTLTVLSSITVVAPSATLTPSTTSTSGLGGFIMQGLDDVSASSSLTSTDVSPSDALVWTNTSNATVDWEACQTSQVSWSEAWSSAYDPKVVTYSSTRTRTMDTITFNVTFGSADVYTTIDGIPHAHGELKPTSTSQSVG